MPAARDAVEGRCHLRRANNNVYRPEKSWHYYYYNLSIKSWKHLLFVFNTAYVYAETTLLNITDHHLRCQPA